MWSVVGWIAVGLSGTYKLPQIYLLWSKRETNGLSVFSYIIQTLSYTLYMAHGRLIDDVPCLSWDSYLFVRIY